MNGLQLLVIAEVLTVIIADITAAIVVFRIYLRNRRTSTLAFSLAWVFDLIFVISLNNPTLEPVGLMALPTFSGLIFYGAVKFLEEESLSVRRKTLSLFSLMPPAFMLYMLSTYWYTKDALWTATIAASFGISGVFVIGGGMLLYEVREIYKSAIKYLSAGVILFGLHLVPAALFGKHEWYGYFGLMFSATLIVFFVWAMVKLTSFETFRVPEHASTAFEIELKPGVLIVDTKDYPKVKEKLRDAPVLAFLRDLSDVPENWEAYFVTTIPFEGNFKDTIPPTSLAKITELSYQYLESLSKLGKRGIILIDCFEYLSIYNSWESLMKFLSKLRDLVLVNNGTLILVVEKDSLSENRYAQLRKLLE